MKTKKFVNNKIHYIKETWDNGAINIYPDPEFQPDSTIPPDKLPLPDLSTTKKQLDFIISELNLKVKYKQ
ncbi:hypothetical protein ES703_50376 [subsurface metagenome]